jgi:hypothetical protein
MDAHTTALVIAGVAYASKEGITVLSKVVGEVLTPSAAAIGEGLSVGFQAWAEKRKERATRVVMHAAALLEETHRTAHPVPGRILWPLLAHASEEENSTLREQWARLLANAAAPAESPDVLPAFVHILSELSPREAQFFADAYDRWQSKKLNARLGLTVSLSSYFHLRLDQMEIRVIEDNLVRLQLIARQLPTVDLLDLARAIESPRSQHTVGLRENYGDRTDLTALGAAFLNACMWIGQNRADRS